MILLEKSLLVLEEGVIEGRKVFANILKYVRMGASRATSATCSACSGPASSCRSCRWLPIQILANNLLYDIGQTAIPTDDVDPEQIDEAAAVGHQGSSRASSSSSARARRSSTTRRSS